MIDFWKHTEGRRLEFKGEMPAHSDLAKTVVAFANDAGGDIYIGIDNKHNIVGLPENGLIHKLYQLPYAYKIRHEMRSVLRRTERYMFQINKELLSTFTDAERTRWDLILLLRRVSTVDVYLQVYAEQMIALFQRILDHSVGQQSRPVRQAQQFIRQNYAASLSLETVARQVGLSPVYFSAIFKKETGIGFSDYLNQCRIEQAKKLLEETGLKVHAVSEAVGFSGPRYFSRVFRNLVGVRPSEYRIATQRSAASVKRI